MIDLPKRLRIKASMIALGERIPWGSDTALMEEAAVRLEDQAAEIDRLRNLLSEKVIDSTKLRELVVRDGRLDVELEGGACALMAQAFGKQLFESGAENYIEASFESPAYPNIGQITVTVRREAGKTPHELRIIAEKQRDQLRAEVEALRNLLRHAQPIIKSHAGASHMIEGFRPKRNQWDELAETIDAAIQEENK